VFRYGCALLAAAVAAAVRFFLQPWLQDSAPFVTFYVASFAVAYYCGTRPAVFTTLLGALAADYFFIPPLHSLHVHSQHDAIWLALYAVDCGVAILLIWALTTAKMSAEQARRALQQEIAAHLAADADRDRLLALIDLENDAIITATPEGVISGWSAGAEAMYGWTAAEVTRRPLRDLLFKSPTLADQIDSALSNAGRWEGEIRCARKGGAEVIVEAREVLARDRCGSPEAILKVDHDITARKKAEEQLRLTQKFETVGVLAGGLAHEINNLMTVVTGNCELVREQVVSPAPRQKLQTAIQAGQRASQLAQQLTAYAGKGAVIIDQVNINDVVAECADLLRSTVPKTQRLDFDLAENPPLARLDSSQVQQVVANLVINAAEAIGEAAGAITVRTGVIGDRPEQVDIAGDMRAGDHVYIAVTDTGAGIGPEIKARIFDPFFSTKFLGRGLGLAAVAGIARRHQGGVSVRSARNAGSTFTVFFPVLNSRAAPVATDLGSEADRVVPSG
jgi:PAS domain S-box-containing protein